MKIRRYESADLAALKEIHAQQNLPYEFPDLDSPLFLIKLVLEDEGQILMASALRLTAETYLFANKNHGTPHERLIRMLAIHEATRRAAHYAGLEDVHAWLPPIMQRSLGRRLIDLGWKFEGWASYSRRIEPN